MNDVNLQQEFVMLATSLNVGLTKARGLINREPFSYKAAKSLPVYIAGRQMFRLRASACRMGSGSHYPMGIGRLN
jgi:hypothetical protein